MAAITQSVQKLIRNLKDSSKVSLQCGALTYIRSNAEKLESTSVLKEEEYSEICKLVIDAITSVDLNTRNEATKALHVVLKYFKRHSLKFFESALQFNRKKRLKIFQFLETIDDSMVSTAAQDPATLNFMSDCMYTVQTSTMEWLLPSSCTDNLQRLAQAESRSLSDEQELEEQTINYALALLQRLYKIASVSADYQSTQRFDTLLMDRVVTLAYMGHKKQRAPAIKLLYEAIDTNLAMHIKTKYLDVWARYKSELQGPYCTRMSLLVKACELDWASQWSISIRLLGSDLHRGATLINNLLSVEERAFKSTDTNVRRQAFVSWKLLVDNFALDPKELSTARRIKLLCVPLTAKNSKSELIALTKLEVWWYLITKLYQNITKFADPVVTQFLNFCFGPLGDTPLLSANVDVIASPGKRFYKTKIVAIDALLQLIVRNQEDRKALAPILEERLTNSIPDQLFGECYKAFLHSIGEAIVIISQLHENEMKNREEIIKVLLTNLISYVQSTRLESKAGVYNEFILVVTELQNRALGITCVNNFVCEVVVPELSTVAADFTYPEGILLDLLAKILTPSVMKTIQKKHCDAIKALLWQALKPKGQTDFHSGTLQFLGKTIMELKSVPTDETGFANCFELWFAYAEIAHKYASCHDINEGTGIDPSFKTIEAIIHFPFAHMYSRNSIQAQIIAANWKDLYKQFECKADAIPAVKANEIFDNTSKMIKDCLLKNEKCYRIAVYCLDALLSTINYQDLLARDKIPTIVRLVADLTVIALHEGQPAETDCALKALSSLLITVYGHSPERALAYLKETGPAVELMLKTDAADFLIKEVTSTWETIVSILRGLSALLDANFLRSYKEIILSAVRHSNAEIATQGEAVIAMKGNFKETAKAVLVELDQKAKKTALKIKSDKAERSAKQVKLAGSFMNRKIPSPRPILGKQKEKEKKLAPPPPEPDSQDYVVIQSELKLDVNRLTEHQKESLKRRRDDIPAMYNDLSQSSSQDTQDLQQWFDVKAKQAEPPSAAPVEKEAAIVIADDDHDKENNIDKVSTAREEKVTEEPVLAANTVASKPVEEKCTPEISTAAIVPSDQGPAKDFATLAKPAKEPEKPLTREKRDLHDAKVYFSPVHSPLVDHSYVGTRTSRDRESPRKEDADEIVAKKLDFESRDEYPNEKEKTTDEHPDEKEENADEHLDENERDADEASCSDTASTNGKGNRPRRSSKTSAGIEASIAQSVKRARMLSRGRPLPTGRELRNSSSETQDQSSGGIQTRGAGKSRAGLTRRSQPVGNPAERGIKRKAASDSESEGSEKGKRFRRKSSRSPSGPLSETETSAMAPIDKRTENEMSRLRIDMVFDGPLPSRRRSKATDCSVVCDVHGKRQHSPEPKAARAKSAENRSSDNSLRRSLRGSEKESAGSADLAKKRRRRSGSKGDEKFIAAIRQMLQDDGSNSESQTIVDDEETPKDAATASNAELGKPEEDTDQDTPNIIVTEAVVETNIPESLAPNATKESPTNDDDDVVENSQANPPDSARNRKSMVSALQFARANSAEEIQAGVLTEEPAVNEPLPRSSSPLTSLEERVEHDALERDALADDKTPHDDSDETFLDISAIRPQPVEDAPPEDAEKKAPEENKTNGTSAMPKTDRMFNFSSPKNPAKRFTKPRGFAVHGRAAHMLGLVTKLAVLEKDGEIDGNNVEEEILTMKRNKVKENDSEQLAAKRDRPIVFKDPERMGSPGGSRQEKIFNNMKSADYALSPPAKLFGNLKNNGEKVSPKMGKMSADATASSLESDASSVKDDSDDISQSSEKNELPMLEWSSANPPSLTASPSASILKRIRQIASEAENDGTPNKSLRKRVSFADPPVSKEMGYEIASGGSPLKTSKFTSRSLFDRKNSPIRLRLPRMKMFQVDSEKTEREEEPQPLSSSEMDMDCERENALLVKIAEDLEDTADLRTTDNFPETIVATRLELGTCEEVEIGESLKSEEDHEKVATVDASAQQMPTTSSGEKDVTIDDIETQEDLFNSSDEKNESPRQFVSRSADVSKEEFPTQSTTIDSLKLNVTDDSVIGSLTNLEGNEHDKSECLEDTVDVRNITSLNSTGNSDEMFCEKPLRTSTEAPEGFSQMDTLPVTDSIFASLPISQDSQDSTQANMELAQPRLLNATDPIYPSLVNCEDSIDFIVSNLTNYLWITKLSKRLEARGIATVGDLARLSEREIARLPVRGSPKVDYVRKVLRRFEEKLPPSPENLLVAKMNDNSDDYLALVSDKDISMNIDEHMDIGDLPTLDVSAVTLPSQEPTSDSVCVNELNSHSLQAIRRTSTTMASSDAAVPSVLSVLVEEAPTVSQISTINLSSDTFLGTMVSVGTSTDTLPKPPSKSVGSQMALEELLDEIDVKLVLESAVKRSSAETLLAQYKSKMGHMSEMELGKETMRMLAVDSKATYSDTTLKAACRACGVNKVLVRLPDIFSNDKQFFAKVLNAYRKKISVNDWIEALSFEDIKSEICKKCSPSELTEMLSNVLKQEVNDAANPRTSSLSDILKNLPLDVIISHTVANNELIPSSVVLDIALRNNKIDDINNAIESQYPEVAQKIADRKMTPENIASRIESISMPKDKLLSIHKAICAKLSPEDLLDAYHEAMKLKLNDNSG